ncbi:TonB-dependent receptor [Aureibaculum conchae]|uniref:TonB-dependent receptor n=1 Tax=Aureibaculum sp. 2308TA14-22 TaxID=3108392 RepID=UPI003391EC66
MSKITLALNLFLLFTLFNYAQSTGALKGALLDYNTQKPLENVIVKIIDTHISELTNTEGKFLILNIPLGDNIVEISLKGYETQRYPIYVSENQTLDLGIIYLYTEDATFDDSDQLVWNDDNPYENNQSQYSNSKDVFLKRVGFDFSPTFFSFRGYDASQSKILLNSIDITNQYNNRPLWNTFSGLNDIARNRQSTIGLSYSKQNFGGLSGTTFIKAIASEMRPGLRISSSFSNKNYVGSTMATYNSGLQENGLAYSISASRRWGNEGFVDATLYDAFSLFGAISYKINDKNNINATAIYAPSRKGQTTAITERVFNEFGSSYNPYWGWQEDEKRNSSISEFKAPIFMLGHRFTTKKSTISTNISYQSVNQKNSRLDYTDAPNPYPNYWKYLPDIAENPQISWLNIYETNLNATNIPDGGSARYLLYNLVKNDNIFTVNSVLNQIINENQNFDFGISFKNSKSENFATPKDLLGAVFFIDVNPFTLIDGKPSKNDMLGKENKGLGDKIKYNFDLNARQLSSFAQMQFQYDKTNAFISVNYTNTAFQRNGKFLTQSYENNSLGKSEKLAFNDFAIKAGMNYQLLPNHSFQLNTAYITKAPMIQNSFVNIRENNAIVPNLVSEKIISADASYLINTPKLQSRLTGYFTDFRDGTKVNSFFAEIGSGADFFQEVITNIDKRHIGLEFGLEYEIIPNLTGSAVVAFGQHTYTKNANVGVNFDTAGFSEDLINNTGFIDLGETYLKNYKVANGPQQAYSIGLFYKNPKDWWINASCNYFSNGYLDISAITRTESFFNNPNDYGQPFNNIDFDLARKLLRQEKFDNYSIINLSAGKSWKFKTINLKLVGSIHNLFDVNYKSGGYEQSRTANYGALVADTENGADQRNFGPKYWYGFGRTYFINLALSFKKYKRYEDN